MNMFPTKVNFGIVKIVVIFMRNKNMDTNIRLDEDIVSDIRELINKINSLLIEAAGNNIEITITESTINSMGSPVPMSYVSMDAFKRLTPRNIGYTGGF
jgi:chemotaxis protein CheY-P-specific phosphatase CheC